MISNRVRMSRRLGEKLVMGDVVAYSEYNTVTSDAPHNIEGLRKVREIKVNYSGTVNLRFNLKGALTTVEGYLQIYLNGVPVSELYTNRSTAYVTYPILGIAVKKDDSIQLYMSQDSGAAWYEASNNLFEILLEKAVPNAFTKIL